MGEAVEKVSSKQTNLTSVHLNCSYSTTDSQMSCQHRQRKNCEVFVVIIRQLPRNQPVEKEELVVETTMCWMVIDHWVVKNASYQYVRGDRECSKRYCRWVETKLIAMEIQYHSQRLEEQELHPPEVTFDKTKPIPLLPSLWDTLFVSLSSLHHLVLMLLTPL